MDKPEQEQWRSGIPGSITIKKFNRHGEVVRERIRPGATIAITPEERKINSDNVADPKNDVFKNGMLIPVKIFDTEESAALASNPNLMAESDMEELFKTNWKVFDAKVNEVSNQITLGRLLEVATKVDATVRQVATIQGRIDALNAPVEKARPNERVEATMTPHDTIFNPQTPR